MTRLDTLLRQFLKEANAGKEKLPVLTGRYSEKIRKSIIEDLSKTDIPPENELLDELEETIFVLLFRTNIAGRPSGELAETAKECASDIRDIVLHELDMR